MPQGSEKIARKVPCCDCRASVREALVSQPSMIQGNVPNVWSIAVIQVHHDVVLYVAIHSVVRNFVLFTPSNQLDQTPLQAPRLS